MAKCADVLRGVKAGLVVWQKVLGISYSYSYSSTVSNITFVIDGFVLQGVSARLPLFPCLLVWIVLSWFAQVCFSTLANLVVATPRTERNPGKKDRMPTVERSQL